MIYIYSDIAEFDENDYRLLLEKASLQRIQKCESYRFFIDKKISLIAYLLLLYSAGKRFAFYGKPDFLIENNGKPYISQSGFRFNLSHTREGVMCCTDSCEVGCDIEYEVNETFFPKHVFSRNEYELINEKTNPKEYFTKLWTLKEAYSKCIGIGLANDISSVDFSEELNKKHFSYNGKTLISGNLNGLFWSVCYENYRKGSCVVPEIVTKKQLLDFFAGGISIGN